MKQAFKPLLPRPAFLKAIFSRRRMTACPLDGGTGGEGDVAQLSHLYASGGNQLVGSDSVLSQ